MLKTALRNCSSALIHSKKILKFSPHTSAMSYEDALDRLNNLISNRAYLDKIQSPPLDRKYLENMPRMRHCCDLIGLTPDQLNSLNVIHVTGTKGKGSTCAFTEKVLRSRGWKTGFFSSPHLIDMRERIRINGDPVTKDQFVQHFWPIYNALGTLPEGERPFYFQFLTVVALKVFLEEKVDVAIMEVGIGGRYDCTTVVPSPVVAGICSLGYDHMNVLGDSIESIADNKAGIIRGDCVAFTIQQDYPTVNGVLLKEAQLQKCPLYVTPIVTADLNLTYIQQYNSSLAVYLANWWERRHTMTVQERRQENETLLQNRDHLSQMDPEQLDDNTKEAIKSTVWLGRQQILPLTSKLTLFIDGAHTMESLEKCADWFLDKSDPNCNRVLLFNITGKRNGASLMARLIEIPFQTVIFTTNVIHRQPDTSQVFTESWDEMWQRSQSLASEWQSLTNHPQNAFAQKVLVSETVTEAVETLHRISSSSSSSKPTQVLVTGSLILAGCLLTVLS